MRKTNLKLLLWLMGGSAVALASIFVVHFFQSRRIANSLLWQADKAEKEGKSERFVQYLSRYLDFCPKDQDQKIRLAKAQASDAFVGNLRRRRAAFNLLNALPSDCDPALRRLLVKVSLELGFDDRARKTARDTLRTLGLTDDAMEPPKGMAAAEWGELKGMQGYLFELEKEPTKAIAAYRLAIRHAPHEQRNYQQLARLLRDPHEGANDVHERARNIKEADEVMDALVQNNADEAKAYLARWDYRCDFGLIHLTLDSPPLGKVALQEAREDVSKALQRQPDGARVLLAVADLMRIDNNRVQALERLRYGLQLQDKAGYADSSDRYRFQFRWQIANLMLDMLYDDAEKSDKSTLGLEVAQQIEQVRKLRNVAMPGASDYLEGRLRLYEKRWAEAEDLLTRARTVLAIRHQDLTAQVDLYLGKCYENLDEPGKTYEAYSRVLEREPQSIVARLGRGTARWTEGRLDEAAVDFHELAKNGRIPDEAWLDVARLEVTRMVAKGDKADWRFAEQALVNAQSISKRSAEIYLLRAEMLRAQKKPAQAEKELTDALTKDVDQKERLYAALIDLAARDKDAVRLKSWITESEKLGDTVELRLARARLLVTEKGATVDETLRNLAKAPKAYSSAEQSRLLSGMAEVQFRRGNLTEARALCTELASLPQNQGDMRMRLLLFDLAQKAGDEEGMDKALEGIASLEQGQGVYHSYAKALRLLSVARDSKTSEKKRQEAIAAARKLLDEIRGDPKGQNWAPVYRARAQLCRLTASPEQAITELKQAIALGDTSPPVVEGLIKGLYSLGRLPEAEEQLRRFRPMLANNTELTRIDATLRARRGDTTRALELAKDVVAADSRDPADLVWYSWLIEQTSAGDKKKIGEAEQKLNQAIEVAPTEPAAYIALVRFLVGQQRLDDARNVIERCKTKIPAERAPLAIAQCMEELGQSEQTMTAYEQALKARPTDVAVVRAVATYRVKSGRTREATELLRQIIDRKIEANAEDVAWARRGLALVLSGSNDFASFREAMLLVGLPLDANGRLPHDLPPDQNTDNQRTRARVLAAQTQRAFREKAVEMLESLAASGNLTSDDLYVLALLHDAAGSWEKCKERLQEIVTNQYRSPQTLAQPQTAVYVAQYVQGLIRNKEFETAKTWLERLKMLEKQRGMSDGGLGSVELTARLLEKQGQRDQALDLLRDFAKRPGAAPQDLGLVLLAMARQERFDEAFGLWPEVARTCPPEGAGGLSVALLRSMKPTDEQVKRVETWLKNAIKDHPEKLVLHMHLADVYDLRGVYAEAEKEWKFVLEKEPNNVVALNNLAWLMAHRTGEEGRALPLIEAAVAGQGRRADLLDTRGMVQLNLGKVDLALADFKEAVADYKTPARLYHLARALQQSRDRENAGRVLREAKEMGLNPAEMHPVEQRACRQMLMEFGLQ